MDRRRLKATLALEVGVEAGNEQMVGCPALGGDLNITVGVMVNESLGHAHLVPHLLAAGLHVDGSGVCNTLYLAALTGHDQVVKELLRAPPHLEARDNAGECEEWYEEMLRWMRRDGSGNYPPRGGRSPAGRRWHDSTARCPARPDPCGECPHGECEVYPNAVTWAGDTPSDLAQREVITGTRHSSPSPATGNNSSGVMFGVENVGDKISDKSR
ncbi:hypothetical protein Hamer_G000203 [Homarus americanus]|uniref:Uncharacterized protein n=1 Tax=Homarus americanus TaxID=6706 RepID=A0A8J5TTV1_HOMAM|nr:hypothetical protein Hamer_G000203 [Homarus americanus]